MFDDYETLNSPVFAALRDWGDDYFWGRIFLAISILRLLALYRNGSWSPSPWLRLFTAMASAVIWALISLGIMVQQTAFVLLAIFPWFVAADIYSVGRAASDARLSREDRLSRPEAPQAATEPK